MADSKTSVTEMLPEVYHDIVKKLKNLSIEGDKIRERKNIFLFGYSGAGKSTLINSLIMALNEEGYAEYAFHGYRGTGGVAGAATISEAFRSYDVLDCANRLVPKAEMEQVFRPYLFDIMGLGNSSDGDMMTIIRGLISGAFPLNTMMSKIMNMSSDKIAAQYNLENPEKWDKNIWADVCLFVLSAIEEPPENLLKAVYDAAKRHVFEVPVFLVITKMDKVGENERNGFQARKERAMRCLGLEGTDERVFMLTNYCAEVTLERDRKMDQELCKLWKTVLGREYRRRENFTPEEAKSSCALF